MQKLSLRSLPPRAALLTLLLLTVSPLLVSPLFVVHAAELQFREQELPSRLGVGYAVALVDMNNNQRLDIVVVDQTRIIWLENPNWNEHVLTENQTVPDNVCLAPHDINGDGHVDFAVGAGWRPSNTKSGGTIQWITRGKTAAEPWNVHPIGEEPTVHRMRFADLNGDGRQELIVGPLLGRNTTPPHFQENGVRLLSYQIPEDPVQGPWKADVITDQFHVTHNFWPTDFNGNGQTDILLVSFEGVTLLERQAAGDWHGTRIGTGNQETSPNRGASEIKLGRLAGGGDYIATIEPWHGHQVVVYTRPQAPRPQTGEWLWDRHVIDEELKWGHAVWCADLDGDGDEELIIGVRDDKDPQARRGLRIYDPQDRAGTQWKRHVIDPGGVAIEDLAAADLNGNGRVDIVAVGRQTHNVKIYWNESK